MKLIRDLIPADMERNGYKPELRVLHSDEILPWLYKKLEEEAREVADETSYPLEELADVLEVVYSIAERLGYSLGDVEVRRQEKALKYGRFAQGWLWLNSTDESREAARAAHAYHSSRDGLCSCGERADSDDQNLCDACFQRQLACMAEQDRLHEEAIEAQAEFEALHGED